MSRLRLPSFLLVSACVASSLLVANPIAFAASCCKCKTSEDATQNVCLTITKDGFDAATQCNNLATFYPSNEKLKALSCESMECGSIKLIPDGGTCSNSGLAEAYGATATPTDTKPSITPQLQVPLPGLSFPSKLPTDGGMIQVPFLAIYIGAIYKYLVGIAVIAAAVMVVYGGFKYILGASFTTITTGKQTIQDALIGLVLIFGSYTLLASLNPATVAPQTLNIQAIAQTAYTSPAEEKKRVIEAATVPSNPEPSIQESTIAQSGAVGSAAGAVSALAEKAMKAPGTVVQDANGNYVAQGRCPNDMKAIPESDSYKKGRVPSFCMDTFEAPNGIGKIPLTGFNEFEAEYYCKEQGKRLCNESEWLRACLGPNGDMLYSYSKNFIPDIPGSTAAVYNEKTPANKTVCNNNTAGNGKTWFSFERKISGKVASAKKISESVFNPENADRPDVVAYFGFVNGMKEGMIEPSGKRPTCVSPEGVFDLVGNAQEIVVSTAGEKMSSDNRITAALSNPFNGSDAKPYTWKGYFWIKGGGHGTGVDGKPLFQEPDCNARWGKTHALGYRTYENTARCCMFLDLNTGN